MENKIYIPENKKLLDPRIDSTFKSLFTRGEDKSKDALKQLVGAIIGHEQRASVRSLICQGHPAGPPMQDARRRAYQHRDADLPGQ